MRRFMNLLKPTLVAWYLATLLAGPGLHELPGFAHEQTLGCSTDNHSDRTAPSESRTSNGDGHCLICHFLAQGQINTEQCSVPLLAPAVIDSAPISTFAPEACHWHLANPRAPPISLGDIS
jgi:hypothetical protein